MVHVVRATEVLVAPVVVGICDVGVMVKSAQVLRRLTDTPTGSITFFLCLAGLGGDQCQRDGADGSNANSTKHGEFLRWDGKAA